MVNDLGASIQGDGADQSIAASVAEEIDGIPDDSDVSTPEGAQAVVERALDRFGRIDVLVNNAGIMRWADVQEIDPDTFEQHLAVHVGGSFNTARAAWPHFVDAGYGRIVNTTSSGVFGLPNNVAYAAAKGAVIGLTRSLASAGTEHGICVNAIAPAAMTRMAGPGGEDEGGPMAPDLAAPMVAFLAHERCRVSGEIYTAGAGRFGRLFMACTEGYVDESPAPTIEDVAEHWKTINDESGYYVPTDLPDWSTNFTKHLR